MNVMRQTNACPHSLCDLEGVKTPPSCPRGSVFATLLLGSVLALHGQTNDVTTKTSAPNVVPTASAATSANTNAAVAAAAPEARPASASGKLDYSSFKVVADRNIFNGNRSGQRMVSTRSSSQQRSVRVESFSLVGTLLTEDRPPVAFFDGSSSEFRKALKVGSNIAGFTVKEILHAGVRLAQGTNTLDVRVGTGLRREDEGLWKSSEGGTSYAGGSSSSFSNGNGRSSSVNRFYSGRADNGEGPAASSSSAPAAAADAAEILKRLMEKREKE
jgi:hypothetical protein